LRISNELYLKRAVVAGFERVFEFSRDFRNEGIDRSHNPEFTMLEFYWAYANYEDLMVLTEEMISEVLMQLHGQLKINYQGQEVDFTPPYKRISLRDLIKQETNVDIKTVTKAELLNEIKKRKIEIDTSKDLPMKDLIDEFYKETCRVNITQPIFLIDYPADMAPLAKRKDDDEAVVAKMQLVCVGMELINAYNELNDPIDQLERMSVEAEVLEKGDSDEAQPLDYDYIRALEVGLPPTAGWGMGIDRFVSFLADQPAIKDVILFPTLRPEKIEGEEFKIDPKLKDAD
jgi:lysyl-tRNA synthetase class 2